MRTTHNLSYSSKMTLPFGRLCPMYCEKVVPGDKFIIKDEFMMRFAPFINQVFQSFQVRTEYFFVPSRLLWKNFEMFLCDGIDGRNDNYIHPYISYKDIMNYFAEDTLRNNVAVSVNQPLVNSIFDYFNLPSEFNYNGTTDFIQENYDGYSDALKIDYLPFAAYGKVFMDYYADENLDYAQYVELFLTNLDHMGTNDGDNSAKLIQGFLRGNGFTIDSLYHTSDIFKPLKRSYPKDYFTSALPFAQRGPVVTIPLNGSGDVIVYGQGSVDRYQGVGVAPSESVGTDIPVTLFQYGKANVVEGPPVGGADDFRAAYTSNRHGSADGGVSYINEITSAASSNQISFKAVNVNGTATITDLRTAIAVQDWLEKRARGGARPKEQIYSSFGVRSKDYRLDRAELLYASKNYVNIGEVFTTAQDDAGSFVPGLGVSTAKAAGANRRFKHFFEEHGYVIGIISVFPTPEYFQGIPRQFFELDKYDYFWPEFQHIGEQEIFNAEVRLTDDTNPMEPFGYTPRYAHYKTRLNQVHGNFRTNLNYMIAARTFKNAPELNNNFVQVNPENDDQLRIFNAVTPYSEANPIYCDLYHSVKAIRPMSYFGTPRII